eukprot:TRINITY_DN6909_c0_g1_i1.p1 TRINITY_DN6909_c0_g1~~TRINITY_DN6909_c0_g1_i1.p1  ORF type:complete len:624 (-),score=56.26 TRINITY_DN6909_c0_g1_i1:251-2122(-)
MDEITLSLVHLFGYGVAAVSVLINWDTVVFAIRHLAVIYEKAFASLPPEEAERAKRIRRRVSTELFTVHLTLVVAILKSLTLVSGLASVGVLTMSLTGTVSMSVVALLRFILMLAFATSLLVVLKCFKKPRLCWFYIPNWLSVAMLCYLHHSMQDGVTFLMLTGSVVIITFMCGVMVADWRHAMATYLVVYGVRHAKVYDYLQQVQECCTQTAEQLHYRFLAFDLAFGIVSFTLVCLMEYNTTERIKARIMNKDTLVRVDSLQCMLGSLSDCVVHLDRNMRVSEARSSLPHLLLQESVGVTESPRRVPFTAYVTAQDHARFADFITANSAREHSCCAHADGHAHGIAHALPLELLDRCGLPAATEVFHVPVGDGAGHLLTIRELGNPRPITGSMTPSNPSALAAMCDSVPPLPSEAPSALTVGHSSIDRMCLQFVVDDDALLLSDLSISYGPENCTREEFMEQCPDASLLMPSEQFAIMREVLMAGLQQADEAERPHIGSQLKMKLPHIGHLACRLTSVDFPYGRPTVASEPFVFEVSMDNIGVEAKTHSRAPSRSPPRSPRRSPRPSRIRKPAAWLGGGDIPCIVTEEQVVFEPKSPSKSSEAKVVFEPASPSKSSEPKVAL